MTTTRQFVLANRLKQIGTVLASAATINAFAHGYNPADQRTAITNADSSRCAYAYDLSQVKKTNSAVDIRFHYFAVTNIANVRQALVTDGDGVSVRLSRGCQWQRGLELSGIEMDRSAATSLRLNQRIAFDELHAATMTLH